MSKTIQLNSLKLLDENPRIISPENLEKLSKNIEQFPKMMEIRGIVVDNDNVILGGNQRYKALVALGYTEIPETWVQKAADFTDNEKDQFIILDNVGFGDWDAESLLDNWNHDELSDWGLNVFIPEEVEQPQEQEKEKHRKLTEDFTVPPFTVLDTRQGYWMERKRAWKDIILEVGGSREATLASEDCIMGDINKGVSILDPVLCEIACDWFGIKGGKSFDAFCGDTVFAQVANHKGMSFTGIEIRQEQVELNKAQIERRGLKDVEFINDSGVNILKHVKPKSQDFFFSCPPYYDLEVYSELEEDASNQPTYKEFIDILEEAFVNSIKALKDNRFAFIVVGDIRDEKGFYRQFPDDIRRIFKDAGMPLYNEMILVETLGTLPQRVRRYMVNRVVGKCHQNILVFYKGNKEKIRDHFPKIEMSEESDS